MLSKNLEALRKTNPKLAEKVEETSSPDEKVLLFLGPNEDVNIAYEDVALHRMDDPMGEALELFNAAVNDSKRGKDSICFIIGLGLGYLLRRAFVSIEGQIILFEPYLEVLRKTLEVIDLSQELSSKRVKIITKPEEVVSAFGQAYLYGDRFSSVILPSYQAKDPQLVLAVLDEIQAGMNLHITAQNTTLMLSEKFTRSSLENIAEFLKYPDAGITHEQFQGFPAVVVSAGPSLDRPGVLDTLKQYRENLVIACVGQAAKALDKVGITPDFVNVVEISDVAQQLEGVSFVENTNFLLLPQTNAKLYRMPAKRKLITYPFQDTLAAWISKALEKPLFGYNHQGTVSITALISLMRMGCNPIFLLGQDLAYPEGRLYAENSVYRGCRFTIDEHGRRNMELENKDEFMGCKGFYANEKEWLARKRKFENNIVEIKGWHGETLQTSMSYSAFLKNFSEIQRKNPTFQIVNCSEGGAYIPGMEHLPFPEAVERWQVAQFSPGPLLEQFFQEHYYEEEPGSEMFQKIYAQYQYSREELDTLAELAKTGIQQVKKAMKNLERKKMLTHSVQGHLKKVKELDDQLAELTRNNRLINCYINVEMMKFRKQYGRKLRFGEDSDIEGDVLALQENLENTEFLYKAVGKGVQKLIADLDSAFQDFPVCKQENEPAKTLLVSPT